MTSEVEQIKVAYETLGMSPDEIAKDRELEVTAVKIALMQSSSLYRKDCGKEDMEDSRLNFSNDEMIEANQMIVQTMRFAEDERLKFQAAVYVRDDKKGRKEVVKAVAGNTFNVLTFNESMKGIREQANKLKERVIGGNMGGMQTA